MKKNILSQLDGFHLRVRPIARRFDVHAELPQIDDRWRAHFSNQQGLQILDLRTEHILTVPPDHIHEFREDSSPYFPGIKTGFLMLRSQIWLQGQNAGLEPLDWSYQSRGF